MRRERKFLVMALPLFFAAVAGAQEVEEKAEPAAAPVESAPPTPKGPEAAKVPS